MSTDNPQTPNEVDELVHVVNASLQHVPMCQSHITFGPESSLIEDIMSWHHRESAKEREAAELEYSRLLWQAICDCGEIDVSLQGSGTIMFELPSQPGVLPHEAAHPNRILGVVQRLAAIKAQDPANQGDGA